MTRTELIDAAEATLTVACRRSPTCDAEIARAAALVADGLAAVGVDYLTYRMHQIAKDTRSVRELAAGLADAGLLAQGGAR